MFNNVSARVNVSKNQGIKMSNNWNINKFYFIT